jgi:cephalosporin-C deacetylase-like acetyl esterase
MRNREESENVLIGVAGYGEGGLLALYASALDQRISSTLVSGYFDRREELWSEPIYRICVWSPQIFRRR